MTSSTLPASSRSTVFRNVLDWLWSPKLAARVKQTRALSPDGVLFVKKARVSFAVAQQVLRAPNVYDHDPQNQLAILEICLNLSKLSLCWLLRGLGPEPNVCTDVPALFAAVDQPLLVSAAGSDTALARTLEIVQDVSWREGDTLTIVQLQSDLDTVFRMIRGLLSEVRIRTHRSTTLWMQRGLRIFGTVGVLCLTLWLGLTFSRWVRPNLAENAVWTTSSVSESYPQTGRGTKIEAGRPPFFFHTDNEESPWIEFDLGVARDIHGVIVENRDDCCEDRAIPLLLQISTDHEQWTTIARRDAMFSTWSEWFTTVNARYVRLRSPRRTILHFKSVSIK